jgi:hypothetical protein
MPARLAKLRRALEAMGITVTEPASGSHWKAQRDGKTYPIPAHNGPKTEIDDCYLRGVCRCFGLDEKALRKLL